MSRVDFSQFRDEPRSEFVESLYAKISQKQGLVMRVQAMLRNPSSRFGLALTLVALILVVGACARQVFAPRNVQVGDFWVLEMSDKYICGGDVVYPSYTPSSPMPTPQPQPSPPPRISLQELRALVDFDLKIPTFSPEGFTLQTDTPPPSPFARHSINWLGANGEHVGMMVLTRDDWPRGREIRVLRGAWQEVSVLGRPAVLVNGRCMFEWESRAVPPNGQIKQTWNSDIKRLNWSESGVYYELFTVTVDTEDLIRMAESAR